MKMTPSSGLILITLDFSYFLLNSSFKIIFLYCFYVYEFSNCMYAFMPEEIRSHYTWLSATMRVVGIELSTSGEQP